MNQINKFIKTFMKKKIIKQKQINNRFGIEYNRIVKNKIRKQNNNNLIKLNKFNKNALFNHKLMR